MLLEREWVDALRPRVAEALQAVSEGPSRVDVVKCAYRATLQEVTDNEFNLNIPRYVDTFDGEEEIDIAAVQQEIDGIEVELAKTRKQMAGYLGELGYDS